MPMHQKHIEGKWNALKYNNNNWVIWCLGGIFHEMFLTSYKNHYILVITDYVSKWVETIANPTKDAKVIIKFIKRNIFTRFGAPKVVINDRGSHFYNYMIEKILKKYNMTRKITTPYHSQTSR